MQLKDAIALLENTHIRSSAPTKWADLGCGDGLFTKALASYQSPGSVIYAMDTNQTSLNRLTDVKEVSIKTSCQDFVQDEWPFDIVDGILMANSIHYVKDKPAFLDKASRHLTQSGSFLLVEYNSDTANPWVPYPLSYNSLRQLFTSAGYSIVEKLHERPSIYGRATMYSAYISR
jgi:ubiquinone/menaquinone biosynthesis C-methylase UbiE